jgi:capsular polysaccharide biosynthesis protein
MSVPYLLRLLARRWWVIVLVTAVATGATLAYSYRETPRYEASVSVYAHPASAVSAPAERLNELNLLSYGSVLQTVANIAESPLMMRQIAWELPLGSHGADSYAVIARLQPQTTEIYLSVDGPNSQNVRQMAERLPDLLNAATTSNFAVISLTRLDGGAATRQVQPKISQNALFGGLAGLIAGFVIAAVSARPVDRRARSADGKPSPDAPLGSHRASVS